MKLSKQELKQKISDSIVDNDDLVISLLEDIEDSMVENGEPTVDETTANELVELQAKYDELKTKYKERFLKGEEPVAEDNKENPEMDEEEVIDVKEIF